MAKAIGSDKIVWITSWQIQCCGDLFKIGQKVSWSVVNWVHDKPIDSMEQVDFDYERHHYGTYKEEDLLEITGVVSEIHAIYDLTYASKVGMSVPLKYPQAIVSVEEADGYEVPLAENIEFEAYYVKLKNVLIGKIKSEDL